MSSRGLVVGAGSEGRGDAVWTTRGASGLAARVGTWYSTASFSSVPTTQPEADVDTARRANQIFIGARFKAWAQETRRRLGVVLLAETCYN
jgi:hypothetical protein